MPNKYKLSIISSLSAIILSGCTQVGIGLANLPTKFSNTEIKKDISYGDEDWQKLDLYIPPTAKEKKLPVLVFFYGGRWTDGSKDMYSFIGKAFGERDYIVAIADYSKYPQVKFPSFVEDGAKAVSWVHTNIEQYNGDKDTLFVSGHSSGAHIGALVSADQSYLKKEGKDLSIIKAFAGLAGPYDFIPDAEDLKDMFGPPENYPKMTVTTFIEGNEPPMLLLWGNEDQAVWERNIRLLKEKIIEKNGKVETKIYEGIDHVGIIASLTWFYPSKENVLEDMDIFFNKYK